MADTEKERNPAPSGGRTRGELDMPEELRRRLAPWVDVAEGGPAVFWSWLETVLPALPAPGTAEPDPPARTSAPERRVRELAGRLIDCGGERARLTIACERYFRENALLARRLKALEAALATVERAGRTVALESDAEGSRAAERYLPRR
ncbi:MAG: hypothetical protein ACRECT_01740 [Thermoplasmata archaeon]